MHFNDLINQSDTYYKPVNVNNDCSGSYFVFLIFNYQFSEPSGPVTWAALASKTPKPNSQASRSYEPKKPSVVSLRA